MNTKVLRKFQVKAGQGTAGHLLMPLPEPQGPPFHYPASFDVSFWNSKIKSRLVQMRSRRHAKSEQTPRNTRVRVRPPFLGQQALSNTPCLNNPRSPASLGVTCCLGNHSEISIPSRHIKDGFHLLLSCFKSSNSTERNNTVSRKQQTSEYLHSCASLDPITQMETIAKIAFVPNIQAF